MWFLAKCRSNKLKKDFPNFLETFLLSDGLNHMIFVLCLQLTQKEKELWKTKPH